MEKNHKNHLSGPILLLAGFFCLAGVNSAMAQSATPIFQESFESLAAIQANGGTFNNVTIESGKIGNAASIRDGSTFSYPAAGRIDPNKGTIEFWVKPNWDGNNSIGNKTFFYATLNSNYSIRIAVQNLGTLANSIMIEIYNPQVWTGSPYKFRSYTETAPVPLWKTGEWHKIQMMWDFTRPEGEQYIVGKVDDHYFKYNDYQTDEKLPLIPPQTVASDAKMTIGQDVFWTTKFSANAVIDELKIFNQSLLPVVPFPKLNSKPAPDDTTTFNPWVPESVNKFYSLFSNDGFCSPFENFNLVSGDCQKLADSVRSGENVLFYQKPAFDQVFEGTVPKDAEIKSVMNYSIPPGETEDLFFNVYARQNLNNATLSFTEFSGPRGTISKENLDLRVVDNWFQLANNLPRYTPELLLYNDRISLESIQPPNAQYFGTVDWFIPDMPKLDHVETKMQQFTSKQFVMRANVPPGTPAGTYTSTITFRADGVPDKQLQMSLEVLPFTLQSTGEKYMIEYLISNPESITSFMKNPAGWIDYVRKDFEYIKKLGFSGIVLYGLPSQHALNYEMAKQEIELVKEMGFKDVAIYINDENISTDYVNLMKNNGFEPYFWGYDEASFTWHQDDCIRKILHIHAVGGKVIQNSGKAFIDALNDPASSVYSNFPAGTYAPVDMPLAILTSSSPDLFTQNDTSRPWLYYWQTNQEDSRTSRYFAGYRLWLSNLAGVAPFNYSIACRDCFNEFNPLLRTLGDDPSGTFHQNGMVYPSRQGPIPTIESESLREGIDDGRYLATWKDFKDKVALTDPAMAQESESTVNGLLEKYKISYHTYFPAATAAQMAEDRQTIIQEIKKLQAIAGGQAQYNSDLNSDTKIDLADFDILKTDFLKLAASLVNPKSDINSDGQATIRDIGIMMSQWKP